MAQSNAELQHHAQTLSDTFNNRRAKLFFRASLFFTAFFLIYSIYLLGNYAAMLVHSSRPQGTAFVARTVFHPKMENEDPNNATQGKGSRHIYVDKLDFSYRLTANTSLSAANPEFRVKQPNVSDPNQWTSQEVRVEREEAKLRGPAPREDNCEGCFRRPYTILLNAVDACMDLGVNITNPIDLLVLVTTIGKHKDIRQAIRKTWLSVAKYNTDLRIRYVFLLGYEDIDTFKKVEHEKGIYFDIVLHDYKESYRNLTLKTLMGLQWAAKFCPAARYIMKTDDDMFVNITNVLRLTKEPGMDAVVFGMCMYDAQPIRDNISKWYASPIEYPSSKYPGFCSGTGYVMSRAVAAGITRISLNIPFFYLEDVYVSLCTNQLGYRLKKVNGFNNYLVDVPSMGCGLYSSHNLYTSHGVTVSNLYHIWKECGQIVLQLNRS